MCASQSNSLIFITVLQAILEKISFSMLKHSLTEYNQYATINAKDNQRSV
jgi:hypothetical protein